MQIDVKFKQLIVFKLEPEVKLVQLVQEEL